MSSNGDVLTHARLGLWLGGSVLLHALAVQLLDVPAGNAHPSVGELRVTLLDAGSHSGGATSATVVSPLLPTTPVLKQSQSHIEHEPSVFAEEPPEAAKAAGVESVWVDSPPVVDKPSAVTPALRAVVNPEAKQSSKVRSGDKVPRRIPTATTDAMAESVPVPTRRPAEATPITDRTAERLASVAEPRTGKEVVHADQPTQAADTATSTSPASVATGANTVSKNGADRIAQRDPSNDGAADASAQATSQASAQAGDDAAFLKLLHAAIDAHKRYPRMARRLRREGVATVMFRIRPDGDLDALALADSSGFAALDAAALRAVAAVAPFTPAAKFLTRETRFRVGVEFHLH